MFFAVSKIEQAVHSNIELQNPKNTANPMKLAIYRQLTRTALFNAHSKKAYAEFWDDVEQKKIARRDWTAEMKAFADQKITEAPKPPYIFKITIIGWIFCLLMASVFVMLVYNELKPDTPKSAEYVAMEQAPEVGDVYFGRYEAYKDAGDRIASEIGFGWFKVVKVEGDVYHITKSTEMNKTHKSKEELNSTDFEIESTAVKITKQAGYMINLKSTDDKLEIYITDKK